MCCTACPASTVTVVLRSADASLSATVMVSVRPSVRSAVTHEASDSTVHSVGDVFTSMASGSFPAPWKEHTTWLRFTN